MLKTAPIRAYIPASDVDRARKFYEENVGLSPRENYAGGVIYECGGTEAFLYPTPNAGTSKASQAYWDVADVEAEVAALKARGVVFEEYDMPGLRTKTHILTGGGAKTAWFKDSEGNILAISQSLASPRATAELASELLAIERQMWKNDAELYAANLTEDAMLVFAETGVISPETALAAIRQENREYRRWAEVTFDDVRAVPLTPETAVLNYRATARWEHEQSSEVALCSTVYVRRAGRWKIALHQQSAIN
jgi:predicted enzyme related to lactoylglutathione lyase